MMSEEIKQSPQAEPSKKTAREWAKEAYDAFIKDAADIEPTDPVKAIARYFEKNATDELKARVKAEGKTPEGCYKFIFEVARMVSNGGSCHIDPGVVYAMAMHYFEDVPALAEFEPAIKAAERVEEVADAEFRAAEALLHGDPDKKTKKAKEAKKRPPETTVAEAAKAVKRTKPEGKSESRQGFFFDLLEKGGDNAHS